MNETRKFGWDAIYGPGAMFVPPLAEPVTRTVQVEEALAAIRAQIMGEAA